MLLSILTKKKTKKQQHFFPQWEIEKYDSHPCALHSHRLNLVLKTPTLCCFLSKKSKLFKILLLLHLPEFLQSEMKPKYITPKLARCRTLKHSWQALFVVVLLFGDNFLRIYIGNYSQMLLNKAAAFCFTLVCMSLKLLEDKENLMKWYTDSEDWLC